MRASKSRGSDLEAATARLVAEDGWHLVLADHRNQAAAPRAAEQVRTLSHQLGGTLRCRARAGGDLSAQSAGASWITRQTLNVDGCYTI